MSHGKLLGQLATSLSDDRSKTIHCHGAGKFVVCVVLMALLAEPLFAQTRLGASPLPVFLPAPREYLRELEQIAEDLEKESYVDAITRLDYLLNGRPDQQQLSEDYFLPGQKGKPRYSLKHEAIRLLNTLPEQGRQAYELAYGTDAAQQLEQAIADHDYQAMAEVARNYGSTQAGELASLLLARRHLSSGRPIEALLHLKRLSSSEHASRRFGDELRLLHAAALQLSGREVEVEAVLAGVESADWGDPRKLLSELPERTGREQLQAEWSMFGGNPSRSGSAEADMPMQAYAWPVSLAETDRKAMTDLAKNRYSLGALPALHPLLVGDLVLARSTEHLFAAPLSKQLCRQGVYPPHVEISRTPARRMQLIQRRVWDSALYGQVSSDGEAVYLISEIPDSLRPQPNGQGLANELVSLDLAGELKLNWIVGNDDLHHEPELQGMFFLGVPLPLGDALFCLGERNGEIRVMELEKATGKLRWSQQVSHVETIRQRFAGSESRRLAGANLAYADGILVCPTSTGGVIGIELSQRRFVWGFEYPKAPSPLARQRTRGHWRDNWVMIDQGRVILSPWDADQLFCLDLLTGENLWKQSVARGSGIYVAGVHQDSVLVVGKEDVTAINLENGRAVWKRTLRGAPAGRGIMTHSHYLLATTQPELVKIDLSIR